MAADIEPWVIRLLAGLFGALWGSFFNVAIYRWPREMSVVSPPSRCIGCETPIPPFRNIPILSWLLMRGKAPCCGVSVTPRYAVVELVSGVLCLALAEKFLVSAGPDATLMDGVFDTLFFFAFAGGLLIATFTDLEAGIIPDEVSLPLTALGLISVTLRSVPDVAEAALGAGLGFLMIQVPFIWMYERFRGRRGMGEGDAKLQMMIGAFLGWKAVIFALLAGACQGVIAVAIMLVRGRADAETVDSQDAASLEAPNYEHDQTPENLGHMKVKFGPFLALAALEYLFFGEQLVDAYLGLLRP